MFNLSEETNTVRKYIIKQLSLMFSVFIVVGVLVWYFWLYSNTVTEGEAYSFIIGMHKNDAVTVIKKEYGSKYNTLILSPKIGNNPMESIKFTNASDFSSKDVESKNIWSILFNDKETNVLQLFFSESKLIKIKRYRRLFIP